MSELNTRIRHPRPPRTRGFTLTELLIVIAIAILLLTVAVPAFNVITGSRSVESAQNQFAAILGRARAEAIGLRKTRGVFVFQDVGATGRWCVVQVSFREPSLAASVTNPNTFPGQLELTMDRDEVLLPNGVGIATFVDSPASGAQSFFPNCGCFLFDGRGRLTIVPYSKGKYIDPASPQPIDLTGTPGVSNLQLRTEYVKQNEPGTGDNYNAVGVTTPALPLSGVGFIFYDQKNYQIFLDSNGGTAPVAAAEQWMKNYGTPLLVNRYDGTLIRAQ